jgi:uncharacterized coiled-coil protein SlyX
MAKSPEEKLLKRHADLVDEIHTAEVNHENAVHDQRIADLELDRAVRAGDSEKIRNQQAVLAAAMMVHDKVHDRLTELAQQLDALEDEMIAAGVRPPRMKNINEALTELLGALGVKDAHRVVRTVRNRTLARVMIRHRLTPRLVPLTQRTPRADSRPPIRRRASGGISCLGVHNIVNAVPRRLTALLFCTI